MQAHRDVTNVLLSVLDDGRLTDSQGRTVSFANTVVIMTSNLGSEFLLQHNNSDEARAEVMQAVKAHFRPELLNRLDEIVVFEPLNKSRLREVARMQTWELNQRLKGKHINLELTDAALDYVVAESYDHLYGARPLRRWLEQHVITDLSRMIISGTLLSIHGCCPLCVTPMCICFSDSVSPSPVLVLNLAYNSAACAQFNAVLSSLHQLLVKL